VKVHDNTDAMDRVIENAISLPDGGFAFANLNDFDTLYGHRRDVAGYAAALEAFDARIPEFTARLKRDDVVIITADHGCDPTWRGTDHTREFIPIVAFGGNGNVPPGSAGVRPTFSDIGATVLRHLGLQPAGATPLWE
jgi:phosphopentomutase